MILNMMGQETERKKNLKLPPFWIFEHGTLRGVNSNENTNKYILFVAKCNNISTRIWINKLVDFSTQT